MTTTTADELLSDDAEQAIANCTDDWFCQERALEHVRAVVAQSGTSFGPGMAILSGGQRDAMHAIYAFCREVDDIADDFDATGEDRQQRLMLWREEIDGLYEDGPNWLTTLALLEPIYSFELPKAEFIGMIDGMVMD
ncbi:MAG: squalene/phytoene synthase family protein, partial [Pseudomonadota bacterium]